MGKLVEHQHVSQDRTACGNLPPEIQEQLIEARTSGTHSTADMVEWLRSDPDFEGAYRHVTGPALSYWFLKNGVKSPSRGNGVGRG